MASSSSQLAFSLRDGSLAVGGAVFLSEVPSNVTLTSFQFDKSSCDAPPHLLDQATAATDRGAFLGFTVPSATDRAPCHLGRLLDRKFLSVFRFKTWWTTMRAGDRGRDVQPETRWMLLDAPELGPGGCILVLPLVQGCFRSAIFPTYSAGDEDDGVVLCAESGSPAVTGSDFRRIAYVHAGTDPYIVMREAYLAARVHLGTFKLIEEKALPPMAERFGWCTWDAFYLTVDPVGVWQGVSEFADAGVPARFIVMDDGWQSVNRDDDPAHADAPGLVLGGDQMTGRLYRFEECERFRRYKEGDLLRSPPALFYDKSLPKTVVRKACEVEGIVKAKKKAAAQGGAIDLSSFDAKLDLLRGELEQLLAKSAHVLDNLRESGQGDNGGEVGLKAFLKDLRQTFPQLDDVYVWQALCGAWGGVRPGATALHTVIEPARLSPGLAGTMDDLAVDRIVEGGIGLVQPHHAGKLYDAMHSYLAGAGVTGVKVDVFNTLEYVCSDHGGRVELAKAYYAGLSDSIATNFDGTGIIASMQQCNDFFFLGTRQVSLARAGDDFWFDDPNGDPMGLVLGGDQMTGRLYRFEECERFRRYKEGDLLRSPPALFYDKSLPKTVVRKACEVEGIVKAKKKAAAQGGAIDLSSFDAKLDLLRGELEQLLAKSAHVLDNLRESGQGDNGGEVGLKAFLKDLRQTFPQLDDVYVWQALCGAWGGVRPGATALHTVIEPARLSPGLAGTMDDLAVDRIVEGGIGLVQPHHAGKLYDAMHSYLAGAGVTGVKVDVFNTLEYVCSDHGGRVELAKAYYAGLSDSIATNFDGTGIIASMQQCNDFFFLGTRQVSLARAGDDFWFDDPNGDPMGVYWLQGVHMVNCSYNSLWMGQFVRPDWDMFQSDHVTAAFHAASRAVSGSPIYVSDSLGGHDFALLRTLVFPDGTLPLSLHYALPTRDCLFKNPLFDQETVLKMWNLNKFGGVIGAFNCQGAGWDPAERRIRGYAHCYKPVSGTVQPTDVEWAQREDTATMANAAEYAVYKHHSGELVLMTPDSEPIHFTLQSSSYEIFTFAPVMLLAGGGKFAPVGLVNMLNCGGTVFDVEGHGDVRVRVKGVGRLVVYSSSRPEKIELDGREAGFEYGDGGKLEVAVEWKHDKEGVSDVVFCY